MTLPKKIKNNQKVTKKETLCVRFREHKNQVRFNLEDLGSIRRLAEEEVLVLWKDKHQIWAVSDEMPGQQCSGCPVWVVTNPYFGAKPKPCKDYTGKKYREYQYLELEVKQFQKHEIARYDDPKDEGEWQQTYLKEGGKFKHTEGFYGDYAPRVVIVKQENGDQEATLEWCHSTPGQLLRGNGFWGTTLEGLERGRFSPKAMLQTMAVIMEEGGFKNLHEKVFFFLVKTKVEGVFVNDCTFFTKEELAELNRDAS